MVELETLRIDTEPMGAVFNDDYTHRLYLWRRWNKSLPWFMLIGLNPSKAGGHNNDPTILRGMGFGYRWGYGGLFMFNAYTLVSTDPEGLNMERPLVMGADLAMRVARSRCVEAIACWGALIRQVRGWEDRVEYIKRVLAPLSCLGLTKDGYPRHPVRLPYTTERVRYC